MSVNPSNHEEFLISPKLSKGLRLFFYSQLFVTPKLPTQSFANRTVIITGANSGLGLEAAKHFYRLNSARLILAVRTISKGEEAKEYILRVNPQRIDPDTIEIWPLNLSSTQSTLEFVDRAKRDLSRLDALVNNAGINSPEWKLYEGYEHAIQANFRGTSLDQIPRDQSPRSVCETEWSDFSQQPSSYQEYRYQATKLMEVLFTRELVARLGASTRVIINLVNPGLCTSNIERSGNPSLLLRIVHRILDRTTEVGSRTLVLGASAPLSSHGELQSDGVNQDVESWIYKEVGQRAQKKVFEQTMQILEAKKSGIAREAGL
ncbi:NAD(P)-binding protein [Penicillium malachiteum]|nr:NAD(P)-binding protein [Penicillium malachiteum]